MRTNIAVVVLSLLFLIPATTNASSLYRDSGRDLYANNVYLGVKYGVLEVEDINVFNPATALFEEEDAEMDAIGFVIGGGLNDYLSMEFEYITTVTDEDFDSLPGSLEADGWGLYLAAKTQGDVYFKGRVGYTQTEFSGGDTLRSGSTTNYGIAGGAAVGLKLGPGAVELEYTLLPEIDSINGVDLDSDIDNSLITLGYVWTYE